METTRNIYAGSSRKLVIALDIGTTFSGAAYSLLDPGEVPKIQSVTRKVFITTYYRATMATNEKQILEHSKPWVCESPFRVVLRP